jgi:hypothetical protein
MSDADELAATLKAKLEEEPAEVAFDDAITAAIREVAGGYRPLEGADLVGILNEEIHREAETIRPFLEKVNRRRKLEALAYELHDRFAGGILFDRTEVGKEHARLSALIEELRRETDLDESAKAAIDRIGRLRALISRLGERPTHEWQDVDVSDADH